MEDREMHKAICSDCGAECEVPFKPTEGKPVYCDDCFKKKEKSGRGPDVSKELEQINEKLDKILEAVNS